MTLTVQQRGLGKASRHEKSQLGGEHRCVKRDRSGYLRWLAQQTPHRSTVYSVRGAGSSRYGFRPGAASLKGWESSRYTAAAGTSVHSVAMGRATGGTVVCVHGLGCSHRYFLPVARALADDALVLAPDLPGFGRTRGPREALNIRGLSLALAAWLEATASGGAVLLANSMGCQIVVDLAVHSPQLLGPVVLAGPTTDRRGRTAGQQIARLMRDQVKEPLGLWAVLTHDYLVCGPRRFAQTFSHALADPIETKLHHVRGPTIVARGERDTIVPREWARELAAGLPDGQLVEVPRAPHALNWSAAEELAALVRPLLSKPSLR